MKRLLLITVTLLSLCFSLQAQVNLGMSKIITNFPDTVNYGDTANFTVYVKNYGPSAFTGDITVSTSANSIVDSDTSLYNTFNLLPGDSLPVNLFDSFVNPKYNYQRNIVVIWPSAIGATTIDSLTDSVFVRFPAGIKEFGLASSELTLYPNPCEDEIYFQQKPFSSAVFTEIRILDISGRKLRRMEYKNSITLQGLAEGVYYLEIISDKTFEIIKVVKSGGG